MDSPSNGCVNTHEKAVHESRFFAKLAQPTSAGADSGGDSGSFDGP
jgi:hypothetical protein